MFEKYVNLIRKRAHEFSVKYKVDYSELESQGFLIYCECLKQYDISKSTFSNYLYIQLNKLGDYVRTYKRQQGCLIDDVFESSVEMRETPTNELPSREVPLTVNELLEDARSELSENAYNVLVWIVGREWERKNKRTPTISMAVKYFKQEKEIIENAWNEIKEYWNNDAYALYA